MQSQPITHRLLIEMLVTAISDPPLTNYLDTYEVLPRRDFNFGLRFTNIGTEMFVGGKLTSLNITFGESLIDDILHKVDPTIPELQPTKSIELFKINTRAEHEGVGWIRLKLTANDNNPVEYYQTRKYKIPLDEWMNHFYVLSKSEILLIRTLDLLYTRKA